MGGRGIFQWIIRLPEKKETIFFSEAFRFALPGYNVRPLEMSGAIGIEQLRKLPELLKVRRENAKRFLDLFSELSYLRIQKEVGNSSWFGFSMILEPDAPISRSDLIDVFSKNNIEFRPIVTGNFCKNLEVLNHFDYQIFGDLPNAQYLDNHGLFIGNHHVDVAEQLRFIRRLMG